MLPTKLIVAGDGKRHQQDLKKYDNLFGVT
jgi:hypothetical protein